MIKEKNTLQFLSAKFSVPKEKKTFIFGKCTACPKILKNDI